MTTPVFNNKPNECVTTTDGRKIFNSRSVAVNLVAFAQIESGLNEGEICVAIGKRGKAMPDKPGFWNLPSGYLDHNESGVEAAKREAWEELGLNVDEIIENNTVVIKHLDQPWFVKTAPDENRQNVTLRYGFMFNVPTINDLPKLIANNDCEPNEVDEALWVNMNELDNYEFAFSQLTVIWDYFRLLSESR